MQAAVQLPASPSRPAVKEGRINRVISASSISTEEYCSRVSGASMHETSEVSGIWSQTSQLAAYPPRQTVAEASGQDLAIRRHGSKDFLRLERDGDSIIHLAQFLRTNTPPSDNYMSLSETSETVQGGKSPFKIFRRQVAKKSSDSLVRTMRLPDSAVAAKTIQGHWHIAISIPAEHDHQESTLPSQPQITQRAKSKSGSAIQDRPITVLKPVMQDVRPAVLDRDHSRSQSWDHVPPSLADSRSPMGYISLNAEGMSIEEAFCDRETNQDNTVLSKADEARSNQSIPNSGNKISRRDLSRQQSQQSDARNSTETAFTFASVESSVGHKRGQSSISTAPSVHPDSPRVIRSPKRHDSISSETFNHNDRSVLVESPQNFPDTHAKTSPRPDSVDSDIFSANLKVADTAQGYGPSDMAGTQVIFVRKAQTPGSTPNGKLPDIPRNSYDARYSKRPLKNTAIVRSEQETTTFDHSAAQPYAANVGIVAQARQGRRERVRALRSRDMAKLKAMKKHEQVVASTTGKRPCSTRGPPPSIGASVEPQYRLPQNRSLSYVSIAERMFGPKVSNTMTPIMLVAEVKPTSNLPDLGAAVFPLPPQNLQQRERIVNTRNSIEVDTPPRSITPSSATLDEERTQSPRQWGNNASHSQIQDNSDHNQTHPQCHKSMLDESTEARMGRIEASNAMIIRTLNTILGMSTGFRELQELLPGELTRPDKASLGNGIAGQIDREHDPIESLLQDLRNDVKMGHGELARYGRVYVEEGLVAD